VLTQVRAVQAAREGGQMQAAVTGCVAHAFMPAASDRQVKIDELIGFSTAADVERDALRLQRPAPVELMTGTPSGGEPLGLICRHFACRGVACGHEAAASSCSRPSTWPNSAASPDETVDAAIEGQEQAAARRRTLGLGENGVTGARLRLRRRSRAPRPRQRAGRRRDPATSSGCQSR
jgi:hypothetical protein